MNEKKAQTVRIKPNKDKKVSGRLSLRSKSKDKRTSLSSIFSGNGGHDSDEG